MSLNLQKADAFREDFTLFYLADDFTLQAVRLMHGARDLARRLAQPPGS